MPKITTLLLKKGGECTEVETYGVFERPIGLKAELLNGNTAYYHPTNYDEIEVMD